MGTLQGKIAWVTGAGGGIGEASAKALAESGAHVVLSGRRVEELDRVADAITQAGGKAETAQLDVADAEATQGVADDLIARLGGVDIFMANAGNGMVGGDARRGGAAGGRRYFHGEGRDQRAQPIGGGDHAIRFRPRGRYQSQRRDERGSRHIAFDAAKG